MTPSVLPIRTEVRCVSADELAEINRARPTKKRFLPFDEISDLLLRAQITSFSHDEIQRLADHPDERVPIALIRMRNSLLHRQDAQKFVDRHSSIWRTLSERAVREADREGVLWTPPSRCLYR